MKAILFALFVALLMVGCGEDNPTPFDTVDSSTATVVSDSHKAINLDDNNTRSRIIAQALDANDSQLRGKDGEKLMYSPNEEVPYNGWVKGYKDRGLILAQVVDGKPEGIMARWHENGLKMLMAHMKDGKMNGNQTAWYENGQMKGKSFVKDGVPEGPGSSWYENGQKREQGTIVDKKEEGQWTEWYENGQMRYTGNFKGGKKEGLWTSWRKDGNIYSKGNYRNDRRVGKWTERTVFGDKIETGNYSWNGVVEGFDGNYSSGRQGIWITYNDDGTEYKREAYVNGRAVKD
jgi:antitoxin component YwqK of YwqJK toxin-antitoxin module